MQTASTPPAIDHCKLMLDGWIRMVGHQSTIIPSNATYRISGNFRVIKGSREKISRSKIFAVWAFHENLTHGENVEEYGRDWCIRGYPRLSRNLGAATGTVTLWWQAYLPISARTVKTILPVWPTFPTRCGTDGFFHFSICCSNRLGWWYWGRQRTSWMRRLLRCLVVEKNLCVKFSRLVTTAKIF